MTQERPLQITTWYSNEKLSHQNHSMITMCLKLLLWFAKQNWKKTGDWNPSSDLP